MAVHFTHPDTHLHSTWSDGTDTPEQLLRAVKAAGVGLFSLTDHDCIAGCAHLRACLQPGDPVFLNGVELSCRDEGGKYHILGLCYDSANESLAAATELAHASRNTKTEARIAFLRELHGPIPEEEYAALLAMPNAGKPHFARLLHRYGMCETVEDGFTIIGRCKTGARVLTPGEAVSAILAAGGIPVLAHGIRGEGKEHLTEEQLRSRVEQLKALGLMGLEAYYAVFTDEEERITLKLADEFGLLVTAGSDYHGANKPNRIGCTRTPDHDRMQAFYNAVAERLK